MLQIELYFCSTFIRGQNVMLDQQTLIEMEEKRRKNKEYQVRA